MVQLLMRSSPRMAQVTQTQGRQQGQEAAHCPRGDNVSGKDKFQYDPVTGSAEVPVGHQCHLAHSPSSSLRCWSLVCEIRSCQWVRMRDFGLGQGFRSTQSEQSRVGVGFHVAEACCPSIPSRVPVGLAAGGLQRPLETGLPGSIEMAFVSGKT